MENPSPFEGYFEIAKHVSTKILESAEEKPSFTIWFFRRETENFTQEEFLNNLESNNFGWDNVTRELFYKSKENETYSVTFNVYETNR
jgi:hypothetical protein